MQYGIHCRYKYIQVIRVGWVSPLTSIAQSYTRKSKTIAPKLDNSHQYTQRSLVEGVVEIYFCLLYK